MMMCIMVVVVFVDDLVLFYFTAGVGITTADINMEQPTTNGGRIIIIIIIVAIMEVVVTLLGAPCCRRGLAAGCDWAIYLPHFDWPMDCLLFWIVG